MLLTDKNAIREALSCGRKLRAITFFADPARDARLGEIAEFARRAGYRIAWTDPKPRGRNAPRPATVVQAEFDDFSYTPLDQLMLAAKAAGAAAQIVALDHVQDPHNLGAILRSAAAARAHGVIIQNRRCCPVTAAAYETSCGGAEHVPVAQTANLVQTLELLKRDGFWTMGADERADKTVYETDLNLPLVWVFGAEGEGLHRLSRRSCDFMVKIPTDPAFPSLNVSVAAGVLMFEALRQKNIVTSN